MQEVTEKYDDKNYFNACIAVVFYHCIFALQKIEGQAARGNHVGSCICECEQLQKL